MCTDAQAVAPPWSSDRWCVRSLRSRSPAWERCCAASASGGLLILGVADNGTHTVDPLSAADPRG